jgi:DNA-binding transcriptional MerR regulator
MNHSLHEPAHRIGTIAKLSGVPVPTLRVWESRYRAFAPRKTAGQQRLYNEQDLLRATLLRQLSDAGHAISQIARLDAEALNRLWQQHLGADQREARQRAQPGVVSLAVVGLGLAARLGSSAFSSGFGSTSVQVAGVFADLDAALAAGFATPPQILLVRAGTLHEIVLDAIRRVTLRHRILQVIVVYSYGREQLAHAMKKSGILLRREPVSDGELADLVRSVLIIDPADATSGSAAGAMIPPRRYSDETLARVAGISGQVLCECPRHVAELIAQLASFEQYSQECLNKSSEDAHLHAHLASVSGSARALFERALEMVARHEGIALG